ncbi:hypothetical protein KO527_05320 [Pseudoalteromonas sp. C2R02]|uniref:hypothetical protein n=1 Tax=Pseudoalteromonas sp. C2R02 TaxID=2841565 RepID=UPI001C08EAEC|nr:hypothetical protein [Pseudoalteromonas sp. C2R02]MBU2968768.1 hypothetical protein [Pseudoalteromonas sp. C2R02]
MFDNSKDIWTLASRYQMHGEIAAGVVDALKVKAVDAEKLDWLELVEYTKSNRYWQDSNFLSRIMFAVTDKKDDELDRLVKVGLELDSKWLNDRVFCSVVSYRKNIRLMHSKLCVLAELPVIKQKPNLVDKNKPNEALINIIATSVDFNRYCYTAHFNDHTSKVLKKSVKQEYKFAAQHQKDGYISLHSSTRLLKEKRGFGDITGRFKIKFGE